MEEFLAEIIEGGGLPAITVVFGVLAKYILTMIFLTMGIDAFSKYTGKK